MPIDHASSGLRWLDVGGARSVGLPSHSHVALAPDRGSVKEDGYLGGGVCLDLTVGHGRFL